TTFLAYLPQVVFSVLTLLLALIIRTLIIKLAHTYASHNPRMLQRIAPLQRACTITVNVLALIALITIWGVDKQNIFVALSSVFAVIGVALFAQWSILSNITAGLIIFFNSPFKVGDSVQILDKDFPLEAKIVNILTFYTHLETLDGRLHVYPNNLLLQKGISLLKEQVEE
ncbi:MAG: mechanosensitive ion channel family protein, partial [Bacteroides sp.]